MGVLLLLMTICGLILAGLLLVISYSTKKEWLKYFVFGGLFHGISRKHFADSISIVTCKRQ